MLGLAQEPRGLCYFAEPEFVPRWCWPELCAAETSSGAASDGGADATIRVVHGVATDPQNVYTGYAMMETTKVGIREFREKLAGYLESNAPLAIMRHGETLGYYIPARKQTRQAQLEAMRAAAKDMDAMIASWGAGEEELMEEYKAIRQAAREKKRNGGPGTGR